VGKHCSNSQCFKEKKITKLNSQSAQYSKNKINRDNFRKKKFNKTKHKKKTGEKICAGNTVAIHSVL